MLYVKADGVQPALASYWLVIHVSIATIASGVLAVAAVLSLLQLVQERAELRRAGAGDAEPGLDAVPGDAAGAQGEEGAPLAGTAAAGGVSTVGAPAATRTGLWGRLLESLPVSGELERLSFRLNAVGFMLWTFTIIAGAIWAEHLGSAVGLGSQGGVVVRRVGDLRRVPPRPRHPRLGGPALRLPLAGRLRGDPRELLRRQPRPHRPALLQRNRLTSSGLG